jgi:ATP-dependent Clp protease ATP-binding subunit ClpA
MFERFTQGARDAVSGAADAAAALGARAIEPEHLLVGVAAADGPAGRLLDGLGLGADRLRDALARRADDRSALASLGIDLDAVTARVEAAFGPGALADAGGGGGAGRGGRRRFAPESKRALEQSLRQAVALGDREIRAEHVVLGTVAAGGERLAGLLAQLGQTPGSVQAATRAVLEQARRPAA